MPAISRFLGITIYMYWRDHAPPHVHAIKENGREAVFEIRTASLVTGQLSRQDMYCVAAWITLHQDELLADWRLARDGKALKKIRPLS
jgi:Domain of unknown function (DUF4160)